MKTPQRDRDKFTTFGVGLQGLVENAKDWRKGEQK